MMSPGAFERVYAAIKDRLRSGVYRPGDRLEPAVLSDELNVSVTPVRDALHRLTGERLVEAPRHEGFRAPMITEIALRHLFAWHRDLLVLALVTRWTQSLTDPDLEVGSSSGREKNSSLFLMLARMTGNPEHVQALEALIDRLEPAQRLEGALLDAVEEETNQISEALKKGDRRELRRTLVRYHRRRERIVPELLERMHDHV